MRSSSARARGSNFGSATDAKSSDWCSTRDRPSTSVIMPVAASRRMASQVCWSITSTAGPTSRCASCRFASSASASPSRSRTANRRTRPSPPVRASISKVRSPWRRRSSSATASSGDRMRGATLGCVCIIACMRSIMAARPDGILSAPRSPWPSSTPSASACL